MSFEPLWGSLGALADAHSNRESFLGRSPTGHPPWITPAPLPEPGAEPKSPFVYAVLACTHLLLILLATFDTRKVRPSVEVRFAMKLITAALVTVVAFTVASLPGQKKSPHPSLERLKSLSGTWRGPAVWDQGGKKGNVEFTLAYRVTSGGTILEETMMPGTPGEMISLYYVDDGELVLVHYCNVGNQPRMKLGQSLKADDFVFVCVGGSNMTESDSHMHSAQIEIIDSGRIKGRWTSVKGDKLNWEATADLVRVKGAQPIANPQH